MCNRGHAESSNWSPWSASATSATVLAIGPEDAERRLRVKSDEMAQSG